MTQNVHFSSKKSFTVLKLGGSCRRYLYCSKIDLSTHLFIFHLLLQRFDDPPFDSTRGLAVTLLLLPQLSLFLCGFAQPFSQFSFTNAKLSLSLSA